MNKKVSDLILAILVTLIMWFIGHSILSWAFPPSNWGYELENILRNKDIKNEP